MIKENSKERVGSGKWHPSQFGKCFRAQFWGRLGEKKTNPIDIQTLRKFKAGDLFHDFVEKFMPEHQTEVLIETPDVKGYADIVTNEEVADIKSQHSKSFWYAKKEGYDVKSKCLPNWLQVAWYALTLGKKYCRLVFVSKDDLTMSEYVFEANDFKAKVDEELNILCMYWKDKILPPPNPRAYGGTECYFCGYENKCWENKQNHWVAREKWEKKRRGR